MKKVSIIIRTKNEEKWIGGCLKSVFTQGYSNFEVVLVDNNSSDRTVEKAREFPVKCISIEKFLPGSAINLGIRHSDGDYIALLSGHCIPRDSEWLGYLVSDLENRDVAGVYGRQEPMAVSSPLDKRDLNLTFRLDRIVQTRDSFFHNANSAFRRDIWERYPFDEDTSNIEDRIWGRQVIDAGYCLIYEPRASVFHFHGIHHSLDVNRANKVVEIIEKVEGAGPTMRDIFKDLKIAILIPHRGSTKDVVDGAILEHTLDHASRVTFPARTILASDDERAKDVANRYGAHFVLRPANLSESIVGIGDVLKYSLAMVEDEWGIVDLVIVMEATYPFRPVDSIDSLLNMLMEKGYDTVMLGRRESRLRIQETESRKGYLVNSSFAPRLIQTEATIVGLFGAGCVTHPAYVRDGSLVGPKLGILETDDPLAPVEVRTGGDLRKIGRFIHQYGK